MVLFLILFLNVISMEAQNMAPEKTSVLSFTVNNIENEPVDLNIYNGKVLLVVNVASKCGFTPQYKELEEIYKKYNSKGFEILAFPANNFLNQEPGTNEEIKSFCSMEYGVTFPLFAKISVKGDDIHPLYHYLTEEQTNPDFAGKIKWNFTKFLVDRNGFVVNCFGSRTKPDDPQVIKAIELELKK